MVRSGVQREGNSKTCDDGQSKVKRAHETHVVR